MDDEPDSEARAVKKRRIPKACAACRRSKLRCDEQRPCSRCAKAKVECVYAERPRDPNTARIENLEHRVERLSRMLSTSNVIFNEQASPSTNYSVASNVPYEDSSSGPLVPGSFTQLPGFGSVVNQSAPLSDEHHGGLVGYSVRQTSTIDVVSSGLVSEADAKSWFATFFAGCVWFVPVFDHDRDTFDSVRARSAILLDTMVVIGARAAHGALTKGYQTLYHLLRRHTSDLVLKLSTSTSRAVIEDIQALLVIASYSDSGAILCDVAIRACLEADLPKLVDSHLAAAPNNNSARDQVTVESQAGSARVWYYLYVLDMILSIDGGKPPSITIQPSAARRVRMLLSNTQCTAPDVRLFAQVELNSLRSAAHASISSLAATTTFDQDRAIDKTLRAAVLDIDLWLSEWQALLANTHVPEADRTTVRLNLQIQHAWAKLVMHLRSLTATGIDNIALMTPEQRNIALAAKSAAELHFQLVMTRVPMPETTDSGIAASQHPYVANFRYAMEFVWAKNAFCVLIVLRLSILLGDSVNQLLTRLSEARNFLTELDRVGMGANISYIRILTQIVEKCERVLQSTLQNGPPSTDASDNDFQSFVPKEFMFEWDFPGVHLHYIPLDWQDLLFDIGITT